MPASPQSVSPDSWIAAMSVFTPIWVLGQAPYSSSIADV